MIKAYSYIRFSSKPQEKGASVLRQSTLASNYIKTHNASSEASQQLVMDTTLCMHDLGVSAYKGDNTLADSALGSFINAVEKNQVPKGSYLLVENLDRLSRERAQTAQRQFLQLLEYGLVIVTLSNGKKYDGYSPDGVAGFDLMMAIIDMIRAHDESKIKSSRILDGKGQKRQEIINDALNTTKLTKTCPKWLALSADRTEFTAIPDREELIKEIFEMSANGYGIRHIVQSIEERGIAPWVGTGRTAKRWYPTYIGKILRNRAVLGEFEIMTKDKTDTVVIPNYFPPIISEELFYKASSSRSTRSFKGRGLGSAKGSKLNNLFQKLAVCGYSVNECPPAFRCKGSTDELMGFVNKKKGSKYKYLQCSAAKTGCAFCTHRKMWKYSEFETSFLTHIKDIDYSVLDTDARTVRTVMQSMESGIAVTRGKKEHARSEIEKLKLAISNYSEIPESVFKMMIEHENTIKKCDDLLIDLEHNLKTEQSVQSRRDSKIRKLFDVINRMEETPENELFNVRLKIHELLKQFIDRIEIYTQGTTFSVMRRFFVVHYHSGQTRIIIPDTENPALLTVALELEKF